MRGNKRDAQRAAENLDARPTSNAAGRTVSDTLEAWREINEPLWTQATCRDYTSRLKQVQADSIAAPLIRAAAAGRTMRECRDV